MRPVSLLITHTGPVHVTSLTVCTHGGMIACHDRGISSCTYHGTLPLACGVRGGAHIHLLVGFPFGLVSRVVSFPCECVVLTLSLIASGVESIAQRLGSLLEQKIPAAFVTFPENESNAPPVLLV